MRRRSRMGEGRNLMLAVGKSALLGQSWDSPGERLCSWPRIAEEQASTEDKESSRKVSWHGGHIPGHDQPIGGTPSATVKNTTQHELIGHAVSMPG